MEFASLSKNLIIEEYGVEERVGLARGSPSLVGTSMYHLVDLI